MSDRGLTHVDPLGRARMVDVTPKEATHRRAVARCRVWMTPETTSKVANNAITKGDVLGAARIAGIQAAKRTAELIPLCHPLLVGAVTINFTIGDDHVEVETQVETVDRTGVEMEAMTACAVAALTIYDMCKSADRSMVVGDLALWEKTGGRSGHWRRPATGLAGPLVNTATGAGAATGNQAKPAGLDDQIDALLAERHPDIGV
ncbi:MAG: cyclic pyranopterin monophosphate synthase MoaC [Acidimicrobiaceae bacterium]|nr:cyclic pyranopterin monophosphate synthase MoaC [Acidimicrobiaceae bacterium]